MSTHRQTPWHSSARSARHRTSSSSSSRSSELDSGASVIFTDRSDGSRALSFTTELSSAPSQYQVMPAQSEYDNDRVVCCELAQLTGCDEIFGVTEFTRWCEHIRGHLGHQLPQKSGCPVCLKRSFDAAVYGRSRPAAFHERLTHIWGHLISDELTETNLQPDYLFIKFLRKHGIISEQAYNRSRSQPQFVQGPDNQPMVVPFPWSLEEVVPSYEGGADSAVDTHTSLPQSWR
ncbi:hypothetical protein Micbo1qcDRAFT_155123 [Microdochium bolleyi]|uniref:Uncharacterized protein n=1 Tax=Microdochium bolleyi TaxID=196109 RepID=A0A136JHB2_9PEZI|nr:hypothetical protein Micbo1qcDRAFT_155123 [Microdochium bolleyi]